MKIIFDVIKKAEEFIISSSILLMAVLLILNVLMRLIGQSISFVEEVCQILLIVVSFIGLPYCVTKSKHINMSVLIDFSPFKVKKILYFIISIGSAMFMIWMTVLSSDYVMKTMMMGRTTVALKIPVYTYSAIVPVGFFLSAIEYIRMLIMNITHKNTIYISAETKYGNYTESKGGE